jgi:serine/threonine protein kinase
MLHRNVKPEKVWLDKEEGILKLGDFGISFLKIEEDERRHYLGS